MRTKRVRIHDIEPEMHTDFATAEGMTLERWLEHLDVGAADGYITIRHRNDDGTPREWYINNITPATEAVFRGRKPNRAERRLSRKTSQELRAR